MTHAHEHPEPIGAISQRVREREILRQLRHNGTRKAAIRGGTAVRDFAARRTPPLAREFLTTLLGAMLGFLLIAELLAHLAGLSQAYTYSAFGLLYSLQATYYRHRLAADPEFKIPSCGCAGRRRVDGTESVLRSRHSAILGLPNSVFASAFFLAVPVLVATAHARMALPLAVAAVAACAYLSYVMLARIRNLCATCINIAALTVLILWQLVG